MPDDLVPESDLPPALKAGKAPFKTVSDVVPPEDLPAHLRYPVTEPSELPGRIAGMPGALAGWAQQHPVQAALTAATPFIGPLGEAAGLGDVATGVAPAVRTAAQAGIGAGTAALTGQSVGQGALTGLSYGLQGEIAAPIGRTVSGLGKATKAAVNATREPEADKLAQAALENELGVASSDARKLARPKMEIAPSVYGEQRVIGQASVPERSKTLSVVMPPGESEAGQLIPARETIPGSHELKTAKGALYQAREGARRAIGHQYDPIYGPIEQQTVPSADLSKIAKASTEQRGWLVGKNAQVKPANEKIFGGLSTYQNTVDLIHGKGGGFMDQMGVPRPSPTVGQLRGELSNLMAQANNPATSNLERQALLKVSKPIIEALDRPIPDADRPLLEKINEDYAQISRIFPFRDLKQISQARTLPDLGEAAFGKGHEAATSMAVSRMDEPQKQLMRRAWGSYLLKDGASPTETIGKLQKNKAILESLYPDSDFGKIDTWRQMMIAQKRMAQGPSGLPSQRQFEAGLRETIRNSGLTPESLQAASDALHKTGMLAPGSSTPRGMGRYLLVTAPIMSLMGWGLYHHEPGLIIPAVGYYAGMLGWRALADNPAALDAYRDFIMSGYTRNGADAFGRLFVSAVNDVLRNTGQSDKQAVGHMKDMSEGKDALDKFRAEHLAPTPSASKRAEEVNQDLEDQKKPPKVHNDLNRGRLSLDETNKLVQYASSKDASKLIAGLPLSEVLDALEQASPEEKQILIPLVMQRLKQELPQQKNKTLQANLTKRFQRIQQMPPQQGVQV